jgi:hypothetical protein
MPYESIASANEKSLRRYRKRAKRGIFSTILTVCGPEKPIFIPQT